MLRSAWPPPHWRPCSDSPRRWAYYVDPVADRCGHVGDRVDDDVYATANGEFEDPVHGAFRLDVDGGVSPEFAPEPRVALPRERNQLETRKSKPLS